MLPRILRNLINSIHWLRFDLLKVQLLRFTIVSLRFFWYAKILRRVKFISATNRATAKNTIMHNRKGLGRGSMIRSSILLQALMSTSKARNDVEDKKLLLIGPQTENELYATYSFGLRKKNVSAVDLFSYSPRVDIGDMHDLPYDDGMFDIVLAGWVLGYSDDRATAAKEFVRVLKPGGLVAISVSVHPDDNATVIHDSGYLPGSEDRIRNLRDLMAPFEQTQDTVYFQQDLEGDVVQRRQHVMAIFSIKK